MLDTATSTLTNRPATPADAGFLVDIVRMAGSGMPERVWARMAGPGETPLDVGRRRAAGTEGAFSHRNATLFEAEGRPVAALVGYPLPDRPEPDEHGTPPEFVPLNALEALAAGSWYINILGTLPDWRGRGIGGAMLDHAGTLARAAGRGALSLIVDSSNPRAMALYARHGFREVARRAMAVPGHEGDDAVLMVRTL